MFTSPSHGRVAQSLCRWVRRAAVCPLPSPRAPPRGEQAAPSRRPPCPGGGPHQALRRRQGPTWPSWPERGGRSPDSSSPQGPSHLRSRVPVAPRHSVSRDGLPCRAWHPACSLRAAGRTLKQQVRAPECTPGAHTSSHPGPLCLPAHARRGDCHPELGVDGSSPSISARPHGCWPGTRSHVGLSHTSALRNPPLCWC